MKNHYSEYLADIADEDVKGLLKAHESYGDSWCKRGGSSSFHIFARKFDRLENVLGRDYNWDIFEAARKDTRDEGIIDDVRDLRRYLMLIEAYIRWDKEKDRTVAYASEPQLRKIPRPDPTGMEHPFGYDEKEDG